MKLRWILILLILLTLIATAVLLYFQGAPRLVSTEPAPEASFAVALPLASNDLILKGKRLKVVQSAPAGSGARGTFRNQGARS